MMLWLNMIKSISRGSVISTSMINENLSGWSSCCTCNYQIYMEAHGKAWGFILCGQRFLSSSWLVLLIWGILKRRGGTSLAAELLNCWAHGLANRHWEQVFTTDCVTQALRRTAAARGQAQKTPTYVWYRWVFLF